MQNVDCSYYHGGKTKQEKAREVDCAFRPPAAGNEAKPVEPPTKPASSPTKK